MRTRARVVIQRSKINGGKTEPVMSVEYDDCTRMGPSVGPITLGDGSMLYWPGQPSHGESCGLRPGDSVIISCEVDPE